MVCLKYQVGPSSVPGPGCRWLRDSLNRQMTQEGAGPKGASGNPSLAFRPVGRSQVSLDPPLPELVQTPPLMLGELCLSLSQAPCGLLIGCEMRDFGASLIRVSAVGPWWDADPVQCSQACLSVWLPRCSFWINFLLKAARRIPSRGSSPSSQVSSNGPSAGLG